MATTRRVTDALTRLKTVFRETDGQELTVTEAAVLAGLDHEVCHKLLRVLRDTGFIEQRSNGVFAGGHQ